MYMSQRKNKARVIESEKKTTREEDAPRVTERSVQVVQSRRMQDDPSWMASLQLSVEEGRGSGSGQAYRHLCCCETIIPLFCACL